MNEEKFDYSFEYENSRKWHNQIGTAVEIFVSLPLIAYHIGKEKAKKIVERFKKGKLEINV